MSLIPHVVAEDGLLEVTTVKEGGRGQKSMNRGLFISLHHFYYSAVVAASAPHPPSPTVGVCVAQLRDFLGFVDSIICLMGGEEVVEEVEVKDVLKATLSLSHLGC